MSLILFQSQRLGRVFQIFQRLLAHICKQEQRNRPNKKAELR
jgi:hypothetical protein